MKIGFFTDTYHPQLNGVTISIDNFTKKFREKGDEVYIFAPKIKHYKKREKDVTRLPSFKVLQSEPEARMPLPFPQKAMREVFKKELDIIHAHGNGAFSFLGYQVAKIKNVPYVLTFHTLHTKYTHYFLQGKVVRPGMVAAGLRVFGNLCDGVVTPSEKMKNELIKYGVKKPIRVIPNFIDFEKFEVKEKGYLRRKLAIPTDSPIILTVGRLGKEKNFAFIIRMFRMLIEKEPDAHLVIIGHGPEQSALFSLAQTYDKNDHVHFLDIVPPEKMPLAYADATVFTFASTTETQGLCVLEAAASGLPVVIVKDQAFENMAIDGVNGYILPAQQRIFASHIRRILRDDKLRRQFSSHSRKLVRENFKADVQVAAMQAFYEEIMTNHQSKDTIFLRRVNRAALGRLIRVTSALERILDI